MQITEIDKTKITPMMAQYLEIKDKNKDVIVFFRLGDFYEMFFEDAIIVSRELELTLTGKSAGLDERIPMCGVPQQSVTIYVEKLVEKGYKVGICEQVEDPRSAKGIVRRELVQIVSKGTIMNNESLDEKTNSYIGNIIDLEYSYILSYIDITTGEVCSKISEHNLDKLISDIIFIGIKEIVVKDIFDVELIDILRNKYDIGISIYDKTSDIKEYSYVYKNTNDERYINALKHLLTYLDDTQKRSLSHLQQLKIIDNNTYLKMDIHTKRNLELTENIRQKNRNYSLLWLLDQTKTAMGSRMLKQFIENPLTNPDDINKRYDIVETLLEEFILKEELKQLLNEVYDLERLCGRISYGNANARDLLQLKNSIKVLPEIKNILKNINFYKTIETLEDLYNLLDKSIYENPPIVLKEGYLIKDGYNKELDELKQIRSGGKDFISSLEAIEKERTGIKNLKVGYTRVFGYYIEITKGAVKDLPENNGYERKQTLANAERYVTPLLKEKEELILGAEEKIINMEYDIFINIRDSVKEYTKTIQEIAKVISEIDVLQSFAYVAENNNYIRPTISNTLNLCDARHPIVEKVIKDEFVPNDIIMSNNTTILLLTGPNMAGKSTYMRQLGLIVIMAQIGSFVPCNSALIPIFDMIFTRIGATDDLVSGESTFMVEMIEANNAISNATKNSLILFDELGRGTATYDGMSLAQAIIEYIHDNIGAKTLFSTHYHELTDLEKHNKNLKNIHVSAIEEDGKITFLHKIKDGAVDKSYGIHVAALAKLPEKIIKRANEILEIHEGKEKKQVISQLELPLESNNELKNKIKNINVLNMTPIDALNFLNELKKEAE